MKTIYIFLTVFSNEKSASVLEQNDSGISMKTFSNELVPDLEVTLWEIYEEEDKKPTYTLNGNIRTVIMSFLGKLKKKKWKT